MRYSVANRCPTADTAATKKITSVRCPLRPPILPSTMKVLCVPERGPPAALTTERRGEPNGRHTMLAVTWSVAARCFFTSSLFTEQSNVLVPLFEGESVVFYVHRRCIGNNDKLHAVVLFRLQFKPYALGMRFAIIRPIH